MQMLRWKGRRCFLSLQALALYHSSTYHSPPCSFLVKIEAAISFVQNSKNPNAWAAIGDLKDAAKISSNEEGTIIKENVDGGVIWREDKEPEFKRKESKEPHKSG